MDEDFRAWYVAAYPGVVRGLTVVAGSQTAAEDCAQEAFVRAAERWSSVGTMTNPAAWVQRVGVNLAIDRWRRDQRERALLRRWRHEPVAEPSTAALDVVRAVRELPRAQQESVVLHYLCDLPVAEVADVLGCPVNTVKSHLSRARAALAGTLTVPEALR